MYAAPEGFNHFTKLADPFKRLVKAIRPEVANIPVHTFRQLHDQSIQTTVQAQQPLTLPCTRFQTFNVLSCATETASFPEG